MTDSHAAEQMFSAFFFPAAQDEAGPKKQGKFLTLPPLVMAGDAMSYTGDGGSYSLE